MSGVAVLAVTSIKLLGIVLVMENFESNTRKTTNAVTVKWAVGNIEPGENVNM